MFPKYQLQFSISNGRTKIWRRCFKRQKRRGWSFPMKFSQQFSQRNLATITGGSLTQPRGVYLPRSFVDVVVLRSLIIQSSSAFNQNKITTLFSLALFLLSFPPFFSRHLPSLKLGSMPSRLEANNEISLSLLGRSNSNGELSLVPVPVVNRVSNPLVTQSLGYGGRISADFEPTFRKPRLGTKERTLQEVRERLGRAGVQKLKEKDALGFSRDTLLRNTWVVNVPRLISRIVMMNPLIEKSARGTLSRVYCYR